MANIPTPVSVLANSYESQLQLSPANSFASVSAYIRPDSYIQINTWSSAPATLITVTMRLMATDGTVVLNQWQVTTTSDRSKQFSTFPLTEGFIISIWATPTASNTQNRVFVQLVLLSGSPTQGFISEVLIQGYVGKARNLSWPPGNQDPPTDGAGGLISITGATPAAGAEISETVPTNAMWQLVSFRYTLVSSATVANRVSSLALDDGTNIWCQPSQNGAQTATQTIEYSWFEGAVIVAPTNFQSSAPIPSSNRLGPGYRIRTLSTALQAGDQYSAPQYLVREWLFP